MKLLLAALVGAASLAVVTADCPNACSGNGQCSTNHDFCECYDGFTGADCSLRVCPFASSFIDLPQGDLSHDNALNTAGFSKTESNQPLGVTANTALNPDFRSQGFWERHPSQLYGTSDQIAVRAMSVRENEAHFQAECAGVGLCDRSSGQCNCFPGYGGAACNRTVCPGDCSGHGICRSLSETVPAKVEWYRLWEATKNVRCVCDAGFSGLDCAQRTCPRGDDPLTVTTTRTLYNKGLAETAEVQNVDVRCKFGGSAINPMVKLTYTDPDTMSTYSTSYFDLSTTTDAQILAMLKGLPNDVLADYAVDGVVISSRVTSVVKTEIESSNFWRLAVTFDKAMGDVPDIMVTTGATFLCKNALNVDTGLGGYESRENVVASAVGDGPNKELVYDVTISLGTLGNPDTMSYVVRGAGLTTLDSSAAQTHSLVGATTTDFKVLDNAAVFDRQAALVSFIFEGADGNTGIDVRSANYSDMFSLKYRLTYSPMPEVTVSNPTSVLGTLNEYWGRTRQVFTYSNSSREETMDGTPIWIDSIDSSNRATVDYKIELINGPAHYVVNNSFDERMPVASRAELRINGEHAAFLNGTIPVNGFQHLGNTFLGQVPNSAVFGVRIPTTFRNEVPVFSFNVNNITNGTNGTAIIHGNSSFVGFTPKSPLVVASTGVDTIDVDYRDNEAVNQSVTLVLKIVATSSSPDTFAWKFDGDENFMDNGGAGYPIPSNVSAFHALPDGMAYVAARPDEGRRLQAPKIMLRWVDGHDFDQRVACTAGTTNFYYIQFGSDGLNDRPECADRGICDSSSGQCGCYSGYTGADCSEQNALARGSSGASA